MSVLIVGSIGLDTVKTPWKNTRICRRVGLLRVSGREFLSPVNLSELSAMTFPSRIRFLVSRQIDTGVQRVEGKTFRWSGEYMGT
jgi:hypothetical protein